MLGPLILYLKGMRIMMFQLSGFYCKGLGYSGSRPIWFTIQAQTLNLIFRVMCV